MTFDVEEWFHAANLDVVPERFPAYPSRLDKPIGEILELLDAHRTRATFFVLGAVAATNPAVVRRIHSAGHEIASHGHAHRLVTKQTPVEFRQDVIRSKAILEDVIGQPVTGYRAPGYSVVRETLWALTILAELGFEYDSSIYPTRSPHGRYGLPGAPLAPHLLDTGLVEFPLPTLSVLGIRVPAVTGAYLRIAPQAVSLIAIGQNLRRSIPVVVNIHPWELDPDQPVLKVPWRRRLLHYTNLHSTGRKLDRLLANYRFASLGELKAAHVGVAERPVPVAKPLRDASEQPASAAMHKIESAVTG